MHMLAVLRDLEHKYSREIVIIGVHAAKFLAEKAEANLRYATRRLRVEHPIVSDKDFHIWDAYTVRVWPTLMFVDPQGMIIGKHEGEAPLSVLDPFVAELIHTYDREGTLSRNPLLWQREQDEARDGPLYFPGKILADEHSSRLFITDTGHHRIIVAALDGRVIRIFGTGEPGGTDGDSATCRFKSPEGIALDDENLFVADSDNHTIRRINLASGVVETVAGTGVQATSWAQGGEARQTDLSSPWDLAIRGNLLYVAMAGLHQIWVLDLDTRQVAVFAGAGNEGIRDGPPDAAWFAQPSGLALAGDRLYVADTEASAIRWISLVPPGKTGTIAGLGLFEFGDVDGVGESVRMQHATGICATNGLLYISDTYNNKIKRVTPETREVRTFAGAGEAGAEDGSAGSATFNEPGGISAAGGLLYVADTNNHIIRTVSLESGQVRTLELTGLA